MKIELAKWFDDPELPDSAKARLFGELAKRSAPIVKHFMSDLYRDANYLERLRFFDKDWFYYAIDDWGTHIGQHETNLEFRKDAQYKVTLSHEDKVWFATIEDITPEQEEEDDYPDFSMFEKQEEA